MRTVEGRGRWVGVVVLAALVLAGCGRETGGTVPESLTGGEPAAAGTLLWWSGSDLHVGERTVDVGPSRISQAVSTRGGVYVLVGSKLLVLRGSSLDDTGQRVSGPLVVSPSGRYLAYFDSRVGPRDDYDTRRLTTVLWDTRSDRLVVASGDGLGDVGSDDLADLYEDADPHVLGFEGDDLLVETATDKTHRIAVTSGRERDAGRSGLLGPEAATQDGYEVAAMRKGGRWTVSDTGGTLAVLSPTRRFLLVNDDDDGRLSAVDADGRALDVPGLPAQVQAGPWTDDHTVALLGYDDELRTTSLRQCDLAVLRCTVVAEGRDLGRSAQVTYAQPGTF